MSEGTLIVAVSINGVIGSAGALPWRLPGDLQRFRRWTLGHAVLMGRKTFEAIGKPLDQRLNLVMTREPQRNDLPPGVVAVSSVEQAFERACASGKELMVIGGAQIYSLAWPWCSKAIITQVLTISTGDITLPPELMSPDCGWTLERHVYHPISDRDSFACIEMTLIRTLLALWMTRGGSSPVSVHM